MSESSNDDKTNTDGPSTLHESWTEKPKAGLKWWATGMLIFFAMGIVGAIFNLTNVHPVNIATLGTPSNDLLVFKTLDLQTIGLLLCLAAAVGGIITFALAMSRVMGKIFHLHKDSVNMKELEHEVAAKLKKLRILTAIITGTLLSVIAVITATMIYVFTGVNVLNINEFIGIFTAHHYITIAIVSVMAGVCAYAMNYFKNSFDRIATRIIPEKARKRI